MAKQKRVRMLQSVSGYNTDNDGNHLGSFSYHIGQVVALDGKLADVWIKAGVAADINAASAQPELGV